MADLDPIEAMNQRLTIGVVVVCLILAAFSFALRVHVRLQSTTKLWYDDICMCLVMFLCVAMSASDFAGLFFGSGRHEKDIPAETFQSFMKNLYGYMILWACSVFSVKLGILLFYWRVFPTRGFRVAVLVVACFSALTFAINLAIFVFQCIPIARFWDFDAGGSCIDQISFYAASAMINVCGDVAVLLLPIPLVWKLHTSRSKKWSLSFLFLLGAFVCIASIFRIIALKQVDTADFTFTNVAGGLWSTVEVELGFICANLPSARTLISGWFGRKPRTGSRSTSYYMGDNGPYGTGAHVTAGAGRGPGVQLELKSQRGRASLTRHGSDEIQLTGADRTRSRNSDAGSRGMPAHTWLTTSRHERPSSVSFDGIRVETEVQMTVAGQGGGGGSQIGTAAFASPI